MAVAIANTTPANGAQSSGVANISVVRASGEGLLFGYMYGYEWGAPDPISSVVWDAAGDNQALTLVQLQQMGSANRYLAVYYLAAPTSAKTANITVTHSGTNPDFSASIVRHVTGHSTSAMVRASDKRTENLPATNDFPITLTGGDAADLFVMFAAIRNEVAYLSAGDTSGFATIAHIAGGTRAIASGTKSGGTSVTGTISYSDVADYDNAIIALSIAPSAGGSDTTPPVITGPSGAAGASTSAKSVAENTTAVHTFTADETVTWSITGGADAADFAINSSTGALAFATAPDYESPADADANNVYVVIVTATDAATNASSQTVTVTVTDADEVSPTLSSLSATSAAPLTCQATLTTNEATGSLWAVFTASATAPSVAQIKAGQDHTGSAALRAVGPQAVSGTSLTIASGAVTAGTRYCYAVQDDAAGNTSAVASSASFVVASSYTITTDALEDETNTVLASTLIAKLAAVKLSDMTVTCTWTNQTTDGSGVLTLSHASLTAVPHLLLTSSSDGADAGAKVYTPA